MKIGLLSDTHGYLDPKVFDYFKPCDEIWHAGDIGTMEVLENLENLKLCRAVYGNIDDHKIRTATAENLWFQCEGLMVWITHIGGYPPRYNKEIKTTLAKKSPDIFICGHSHILKVIRDPVYNLLHINPGAAGVHGFHRMKTIMRFDVIDKSIKNMEVIELGERGKIQA